MSEMTGQGAGRRAKAEEAVAEFFGIRVEHIREAPKWCGDGYDGSCQRGECEVVQAVDLLLKFTDAAVAEARREARKRCEAFAREIAAHSIREDHRRMAWALLSPPASAPEPQVCRTCQRVPKGSDHARGCPAADRASAPEGPPAPGPHPLDGFTPNLQR